MLRLIRFNSSVNYAFREATIAKSPAKHYPPLSNTRSRFPVVRIPKFVSEFSKEPLEQLQNRRSPKIYQIEGRVKSIRKAGKALYFIDIVQDETQLQVYASNTSLGMDKEDFAQHHTFIRKNDHISCVGHPFKTKVGQLSLQAIHPVAVVSPCLVSATLPDKVKDRNLINQNRVMDYLVDLTLKQKILIKSHVVQGIRTFFLMDGFTEVQTPTIAGAGTGANAEPFATALKALSGESVHLRVAPELWLKRLVVSGFDKVFEIGTNYRNEGIDSTHNPEFLTCEFYRSFTTLDDLMGITERLFGHLFKVLDSKKDQITLLQHLLKPLDSLAAGNFQKFEFIPTIELKTGVPFPRSLDSASLIGYYESIGLDIPGDKLPSALLDNLCGKFLESISLETPNHPIFIYNQPAVMSPLAKSTIANYGDRQYEISLRFELFINGMEYVNAYEEENSPFEQELKFKQQQASKDQFNDHEALIPDWNYVQLMKYGLPPTGGWGCGIERLAMLLSGSGRIEDVLTFGTLRDVIRQ